MTEEHRKKNPSSLHICPASIPTLLLGTTTIEHGAEQLYSEKKMIKRKKIQTPTTPAWFGLTMVIYFDSTKLPREGAETHSLSSTAQKHAADLLKP